MTAATLDVDSASFEGGRILFANYGVPNCGVHQYGKNLFGVLEHSQVFHFEYVDVRNLQDLDAAMARGHFAALMVNYHPMTLSFVPPDAPVRYRVPSVAVMHEMTQDEADCMPRRLFQYYVMGDPTLKKNNSYVFSTGRILTPYQNLKPAPAIPTIGSFGFSVGSKGFQRLVSVVQEEFDEATIRINIPANGIIDQQAVSARQQADLCRKKLWKPGIRLELTHDFMDDAALLDFLASNTLNAFLYDYIPRGGISSSADHGMIVRRPIAVTRSVMFRHLHSLNPPVTLEDTSFKELIRNDTRPFQHLLDEWSPEKIQARYETILKEIVTRGCEQNESRPTSHANASWAPPHQKNGSKIVNLTRRVFQAVRRRATRYVRETPREIVKRAEFNALVLLGALRPRTQFNRILDDRARWEYSDALKEIERLAPEICAKKIRRANIQQAFVFDTVRHFARRFEKPRLLCVGSFDDSASASLKKIGLQVEEIDPVVNQLNLDSFYKLPTTKPGSYDIIFSTSVLEHVKDDANFTAQVASLLAPGGIGVLTCDFKEGYRVGDPVVSGDHRFYTKEDLAKRIVPTLKDCELVDSQRWDCQFPDFELAGFAYTFATLVFRKT